MLNVRSKEDIEFCMQMFNCPSVDLTVAKRKVNFFFNEVLPWWKLVVFRISKQSSQWTR